MHPAIIAAGGLGLLYFLSRLEDSVRGRSAVLDQRAGRIRDVHQGSPRDAGDGVIIDISPEVVTPLPRQARIPGVGVVEINTTAIAQAVKAREASSPAELESQRVFIGKNFWPKIRSASAHIPLVPDVVAMYYALMDAQTPWETKATLAAVLVYIISPVDLVPEAVLGPVGYTDEAALIWWAIGNLGDELKPEHHAAARQALRGQGSSPPELLGE